MKKNKRNLLWVLRIVLLVVLFIVVCLYYSKISSFPEVCSVACQKPSHSFENTIIFILCALILGVSAMIKPHNDQTTMAVLAILLLLLFIFVIFTTGVVICPNPRQCHFLTESADIFLLCTKVRLHTKTSELELELNNRLSYDIEINGIKCIRINSWDEIGDQQISIGQLQQPIILHPESPAELTGFNTTNKLYCTNKDGSIPQDTSQRKFDCFKLYINYTNLITGSHQIASGILIQDYLDW